MEHFTRRNLALSAPIGVAELATLYNVFSAYSFHELPLVAFLIAAAFSTLTIGTAFLVAADLNRLIRGLLIIGGLVLWGVSALSNVDLAWVHAQTVMPAELLGALWGLNGAAWMKASSVIYGLAINLAAAIRLRSALARS